MVHEVFPGAVAMPTLAQNIVRGNFLKPETVWFWQRMQRLQIVGG